ncbi:MAG: acetyl-CoA synthase subunit gamma [Candidatus Aminicenantes bacterium]|nr:acetyl-CoA synthase subunit gamma [Candidatus Aminicenantes bacterium]NIM80908.1 acetyl-CoA synthase subunit gamma [Candidatus Aminicenantes bacterium]NIN20296.1 acetyl-CoA synthase subunit gamma [Candidatus Aminicenantes bacterium]NIN44071.1 acetyl-CoA synthase subunit gamma [Candidatus Aminicenantes bacterium]NIN86883.1 acetyl-CoA synthase subunit gamma [Candidatus Aminicenantes bacterium]
MNAKNEKKATTCCGSSAPAVTADLPPCCSSVQKDRGNWQPDIKGKYITGWIDTKIGQIPQVPTTLSRSDKWGNLKVRLAIKRMKYKVEPGLYAVGNPDSESMVLVTANYKLSFDTLRKELTGMDAWILVLDTKGINVWCAAGKGTFGTDELVHRIEVTGLKEIVTHRRLIVPQLGATGVAAHKVKKRSGFSVIYGPVRAADIRVFLESGMKVTPEMRRVTFSVYDRLKVIPVEVTTGAGILLIIMAVFFLLSGLNRSGYSFQWDVGIASVLNLVMAYVAGTILGPLLLPWLPGRSFSLKGAEIGIIAFIVSYFSNLAGTHIVQIAAWLLLIGALSSFLTMNFTGASTYTSLSGVKKEMRAAVPLQIVAAVIGIGLWITGRFIGA